jgi:hypothetical protein
MIVCGLAFGHMKEVVSLIVPGVMISLAGQTISVSLHACQREFLPTEVRSEWHRALSQLHRSRDVGLHYRVAIEGLRRAWRLHGDNRETLLRRYRPIDHLGVSGTLPLGA